MKSNQLPAALRFCLVSATLLLGLTPTASGATSAKDANATLEVQVNIPVSWQPMFDDRVAEVFVDQIREIFDRRGYKGEIKEVTAFDEPSDGCCLLTINLIDWRVSHIGNVDCTFTATLQTAKHTRNLGIYTNTAFRWMNVPGRFGLADAFDDAAEGAIERLYDRLAKTELVPGVRRR